MNAAIQIFLVINILLPADVFSVLSEEVLVPATLERVLASLFDRYVGIQMNVMCWSCSLYYGISEGEYVITDDDREKSKKCHKVGKLFSRYNEVLTAQMFINAYNDGMNMARVAVVIDKVLKNLKIMNDLFMEYALNFDTILENIKTHVENIEDDDSERLKKFSAEVTWLKPWYSLGEDYIDITNYMKALLGLKPRVGDWDIIQPVAFLRLIWSHILEVADDADTEYVKMAQEINSLKEKCFKVKIEMEKFDVPKDFGVRGWTLVPLNDKNKFSDFEIRL